MSENSRITDRDHKIAQFEEALSEIYPDNPVRISEEAKKMWIAQHVVGIQPISPYQTIEKHDTKKTYHMVVRKSSKSDYPDSLEIVSVPITNMLWYEKYVDGIPSVDECMDIVLDRILYISRDNIISLKLSSQLNTRITMLANNIAQATYRGTGNYIIIKPSKVEEFKEKLYTGTERSFSPDFDSDIFNDINNSGFIKYEGTINNRIKVFSSERFERVLGDNNLSEVDMIIGYQGVSSTTDGPLSVAIIDEKNWSFNQLPEFEDSLKAKEYFRLVSFED